MSRSIQQALLNIKAPRVKITYDVEVGNAVEKKELPFLVGVLADLAGENAKELVDLRERAFTEIDADNFNSFMSSLSPKISIIVKDMLSEVKEGEEHAVKNISLSFSNMDDFSPYHVACQMQELKELLTIRKGLVDFTSKLDGNDLLSAKLIEIVASRELRNSILSEIEVTEGPIIKGILEEINLLKPGSNFEFLKNLFIMFVQALEKTEERKVNDVYGFIIGLTANIDNVVSKQVDEIMHAPEFQKLEASWRGLHFLISKSEINSRLKVRVLSITKDEMASDLEKAIEFDQSALFKKIYEQEFGTLGGTPYSCLVGDFDFGPGQDDIILLRNIATVAAAAHAPFIGAVNPHMFHLDNFSGLPTPRDLSKIFEGSELAAWNGFRETEDSRYVNLLLPRVLMRSPYGADTMPCKEFAYEESVDGTDNTKFCWGSPAYALAQRITEAFAQYSWTSAIRGVEGGGKVEGLPTYSYKTSNGDIELKCPSEVAITDRREKELSDLGFISLCHAKGTDYAVFFGSQSAQKAKKYSVAAATANAAISARLPYLLTASRFAHYVKMMIRDKIGSFLTASEVETYLQNWLADYVLLSDNAPQDLKAKYPLREGKVNVIEDLSSPGSYRAVLFLRPHFQLEELTVSLRLVASLGK